MRRLRNIGRLFTGTAAGVIENAAVICDGEHIAWCGKHGDEPRELMESIIEEDDCAGGLVTAGLIDAHTHPVYAGDRMAEVAMRTAGASYAQVAQAGGGIRATVQGHQGRAGERARTSHRAQAVDLARGRRHDGRGQDRLPPRARRRARRDAHAGAPRPNARTCRGSR